MGLERKSADRPLNRTRKERRRKPAICGHSEWATDDRFASNASRVAHREEIVALIADVIRTRAAAEWLDQLDRAGIPAGPINTMTQALTDIQAQHRQMVRMIVGVSMVGSPVRLDGGRADSDLPPPALGEHTDEVLAALGVAASEIESLKTAGVAG